MIKVRLNDYNGYSTDTCRNGGNYGFWTTINVQGEELFLTYGTTADMDFCPYCGGFGCHECDEPERISVSTAAKMVAHFQKLVNMNNNYFIEVEEGA